MKAITYTEYGTPDVLRFTDVDVPEPNPNQVLVKVHAAAVNPLDWHLLTGTPYFLRLQEGVRRPKRSILGADIAGVVEAVGSDVTDLQPGDEVFGEAGGGFADYALAPADVLAPKPPSLSFHEAAAIPVAAFTALQGLRDHGELDAGQHVLINGASGGVGTFAVQIAKALGAEVTGVCSTANLGMVRSLGADHVIDYTQNDFARHAAAYDVMLDNVGNRSLSDCKRVLRNNGRYVMVGGPKGNWFGPIGRLLSAKVAFLFGSREMRWFVAQPNREDLLFITELVEDGKLRPVIDRTFNLEDAAEAVRYLAKGHTKGKSVISVTPSTEAQADRAATAAADGEGA